MAKDGVLPALVHLISLLDPREFDAPKRAVGVSLRLFEQFFSGHTPSQGSESVKGRLRVPRPIGLRFSVHTTTPGSVSVSTAVLKWHPAEQVHQFYHQNNDHGQLQEERPALVELVHHKTIQLLGSVHLPGNEVLVVGHTYL